MPSAHTLLANAVFALLGPGLEAGLAPFLLTAGWERGDGWLSAPGISVLGFTVAAVALAALVACFAGFVGSGHGTPSPAAPTQQLMATGMYRYSRNPMYLATAALIAAQAFILAAPILLIGAAVYLTAMRFLVVLREERVLAARFGDAWEEYCNRVPRWAY